MLVQTRLNGIWLITQNDHALLSGRLAHEWWGLDGEPTPLPYELVLATALHDQAWMAADATPRLNTKTRRPTDFIEYPDGERLKVYDAGLRQLAQFDPYTALLISKHYASFGEDYRAQEAPRQTALLDVLQIGSGGEATVDSQLGYLKLFDLLSLYVCMASPRATNTLPSWLEAEAISKTPQGTEFKIKWMTDNQLRLKPFPFRQQFQVEVPYRQLDARQFADQASLDKAWAESTVAYWALEIC